MSNTCEWEDRDEGIYFTECDNSYCFNDGGIADNGFIYCPYCGKRLKQPEDK